MHRRICHYWLVIIANNNSTYTIPMDYCFNVFAPPKVVSLLWPSFWSVDWNFYQGASFLNIYNLNEQMICIGILGYDICCLCGICNCRSRISPLYLAHFWPLCLFVLNLYHRHLEERTKSYSYKAILLNRATQLCVHWTLICFNNPNRIHTMRIEYRLFYKMKQNGDTPPNAMQQWNTKNDVQTNWP